MYLFFGKNPKNKKLSVLAPEITNAAVIALGPGITKTLILAYQNINNYRIYGGKYAS